MLDSYKHSSLLEPFVGYAKMKCCDYGSRNLYYNYIRL
jgi:hypothetical protein